MSKGRYGGFRVGKSRILDDGKWDERKSPSTQNVSAPDTILDFDYASAAGIWTIRSTTDFPKTTFLSVRSITNSSGATISIPATAQIGDVAVLLDFSTSNTTAASAVTPSGWTQLRTDTVNAATAVRASTCYKILVSGDPGATVTGMTGGTSTRKMLLIIRNTRKITSVTVGSSNGAASENDPSAQTISVSSVSPSLVLIAHYASSSAVNPRTTSSTMTEVVGSSTNQYCLYSIINKRDAAANVTVDMTDNGTNALQSFYLKIQ
jgi:hypothetical protein